MASENSRRSSQNNKSTRTQNKKHRRAGGSSGGGEYYHIEIRPGGEFETFRTQDVGKPGHIQRVAGKRSSGYWTTVKWLIGKEDAHIQDKKLIPDTKDAQEVIEQLGSQPIHFIGDRFKARPRRDIPEADKPTPAQQKARRSNIKKAQSARKK